MNAGAHGEDVAATCAAAVGCPCSATGEHRRGRRPAGVLLPLVGPAAGRGRDRGVRSRCARAIPRRSAPRWTRHGGGGGATQPIAEPNCGSVFTNPPGDHAARLIEEAGLKGTTVGGAEVSPKHANFIIAHPGATAADVVRADRAGPDRVAELRAGVDARARGPSGSGGSTCGRVSGARPPVGGPRRGGPRSAVALGPRARRSPYTSLFDATRSPRPEGRRRRRRRSSATSPAPLGRGGRGRGERSSRTSTGMRSPASRTNVLRLTSGPWSSARGRALDRRGRRTRGCPGRSRSRFASGSRARARGPRGRGVSGRRRHGPARRRPDRCRSPRSVRRRARPSTERGSRRRGRPPTMAPELRSVVDRVTVTTDDGLRLTSTTASTVRFGVRRGGRRQGAALRAILDYADEEHRALLSVDLSVPGAPTAVFVGSRSRSDAVPPTSPPPLGGRRAVDDADAARRRRSVSIR